MKSHITMMVGDKPSTKNYIIDSVTDLPKKGKVGVSYMHSSNAIAVENLNDLFAVIGFVREVDNAYIIRGRSKDDYQEKTRRTLYVDENQTVPNFMEVGTAWCCCDFDQFDVPKEIERTSLEAVEYLIDNHLPREFKNVSYIYQWSASAGLEYKEHEIKPGTSVHLFFYLDKLLTDKHFKAWFTKEIDEGFDQSTFNTVTPIFVSSTVIKDMRIIDTIPEEKKFGLVSKLKNYVEVPRLQHRMRVPVTAKQTVDFETKDAILQELRQVGAVYRKGQGYVKLWHNREGSKGDWFVYTKNPKIVHHHVKKSMKVQNWLKEFWNYDMEWTEKVDEAKILGRAIQSIKDLKNQNSI